MLLPDSVVVTGRNTEKVIYSVKKYSRSLLPNMLADFPILVLPED
jgi:hypothetical protein